MSDKKGSYKNYEEPFPYDHPSYTGQSNPPPYNEAPRVMPESECRPENGARMPYETQYKSQPVGESASYYNGAPSQYYQHNPANGDERGLGSTVVGGLAGGYAANQMGAGPMGTAGGAILGATGMNMATNMLQNNQNNLGPYNNGAYGYGSTTTTTTTTSPGPGIGGMGPLGGLVQARFARRAYRRQRLGLF